MFLHSSNLCHYSSIGGSTIINNILVSGFGYLVMDSIVAPHGKIGVPRQLLKTLHFSLQNVHGNGWTKLSWQFVTME